MQASRVSLQRSVSFSWPSFSDRCGARLSADRAGTSARLTRRRSLVIGGGRPPSPALTRRRSSRRSVTHPARSCGLKQSRAGVPTSWYAWADEPPREPLSSPVPPSASLVRRVGPPTDLEQHKCAEVRTSPARPAPHPSRRLGSEARAASRTHSHRRPHDLTAPPPLAEPSARARSCLLSLSTLSRLDGAAAPRAAPPETMGRSLRLVELAALDLADGQGVRGLGRGWRR